MTTPIKEGEPPPDPRAPLPIHGYEKPPTVGDLSWLDPSNPPPPMPRLLAVRDARGKDACFLPMGRTAMLVAPGGTGKTQALMQLSVAVATGHPWLETYRVEQPGPVLAILGEEDDDESHRRLTLCVDALGLWEDKDVMAALGRNLHVLPVYGRDVGLLSESARETAFTHDLHRLLKNSGALPVYGRTVGWPAERARETAFTHDLHRLLENSGVDWRLVILDPASRFMGPECETDNKEATTWIECLERLTKVAGNPTVLFAHHTNKGALAGGETDQSVARGSSALTDGVRWQANLEVVRLKDEAAWGKVDPSRCTLRVVKNNYGPRMEPLKLTRSGEHGGFLHPTSGGRSAPTRPPSGEDVEEPAWMKYQRANE